MPPPNTMRPADAAQALATALAKEIPPEMIAKVIAEGMVATVVSRSGAVEIDHRSRLESTKLALAYQLGRPVLATPAPKTVETDTDADLAARLKKSPALRRSFQKIIFDADNS